LIFSNHARPVPTRKQNERKCLPFSPRWYIYACENRVYLLDTLPLLLGCMADWSSGEPLATLREPPPFFASSGPFLTPAAPVLVSSFALLFLCSFSLAFFSRSLAFLSLLFVPPPPALNAHQHPFRRLGKGKDLLT